MEKELDLIMEKEYTYMMNKYTIEVKEVDGEVKAKVFMGGSSLGSIWLPGNKLNTKQDYQNLMASVGAILYGQEEKAKREEESDSSIIEALLASGHPKHQKS